MGQIREEDFFVVGVVLPQRIFLHLSPQMIGLRLGRKFVLKILSQSEIRLWRTASIGDRKCISQALDFGFDLGWFVLDLLEMVSYRYDSMYSTDHYLITWGSMSILMIGRRCVFMVSASGSATWCLGFGLGHFVKFHSTLDIEHFGLQKWM